MKNISYLLFVLCLFSCGSIKPHPKEAPNKTNSIILKATIDDVFKFTLETLTNLDLIIKEADYSQKRYIISETKTSGWTYLLAYYGNYGSLIGVYFKESSEGTVLWVETAAKFKSIGALFEKDWGAEVLNSVVSLEIDARSKKYSILKSEGSLVKNQDLHTTYKFNSCTEKNIWAQTDTREQGGGWIWFLGKGSSSTLKEAYHEAEGMALHRFSLECVAPHINTRMIERCDDILKDGSFVAYVRANLKESECSSLKTSSDKDKNKLINPQLKKIADGYK